MLKLHQLFLRTFSLIFLLMLTALSVTIYFWSKHIYLDQIEKNLSQDIDALAFSFTNLNNIKYIAKTFKAKTGNRITIIDENGVVIADSDDDIKKMENHLNREEIVQANNKGYGKKIRFSDSVKKELLYVAKKIAIDDKLYYIRLSDYTYKIQDNFTDLIFKLIAFVGLFLVIFFIITYYLSLKIKYETNSILNYLIKMSDKKPSEQIYSNFCSEFNQITILLNKVAHKLSKKQKQKAKQNAKLKLVNRQKDEIISAISHEFKNPIAVILGYIETILNDKDLPEKVEHKFLNKIYTNANKMSFLIDKLRLTLKLEEGKQEILTTSCSIRNILNEIIDDLKEKYTKRDIKIDGDDITIKVDETLFSMALSNLIENGLKYSEDEVLIKITNSYISIIDKGIGIDENDIKKINQKFYRVSQNGWNNSLGLGLFIVHSILKLHKFELKIYSKPQEGSEFRIIY